MTNGCAVLIRDNDSGTLEPHCSYYFDPDLDWRLVEQAKVYGWRSASMGWGEDEQLCDVWAIEGCGFSVLLPTAGGAR